MLGHVLTPHKSCKTASLLSRTVNSNQPTKQPVEVINLAIARKLNLKLVIYLLDRYFAHFSENMENNVLRLCFFTKPTNQIAT